MDQGGDWEEVTSSGAGEAHDRDTDEVNEVDELQLALEAGDEPVQDHSKKPARRGVSRTDRDDAASVHRASVLCLIARARLLEAAACDPETQALMLSHMDAMVSPLLNSGFDTQRAASCLPRVLAWLLGVWPCLPEGALLSAQRETDEAAATSLAQQAGAILGARRTVLAAAAQGGPVDGEVLVALFVALMRGVGYAARVVRLLDGAPLTPWKRPPSTSARAGPKRRPAPATKAVAAVMKGTTTNDGNSGGVSPAAVQGQEQQPRKRPKHSGDAKGSGATAAVEAEAQEADKRRNRGDEEFEAQLRMAMLATEAEAGARQAAGITSTAAVAASAQQGADTSAQGRATPNRGTGRAALRALMRGTGRGAASGRSGARIFHAAHAFASCWAEVWCGSAEYGRWVHVDVVAQLVDKADTVAAAAVAAGGNAAASGYVIAVERGAVRDVTPRYLPGTLAVRRLRDNAWWADTVRRLAALPTWQAPPLPPTLPGPNISTAPRTAAPSSVVEVAGASQRGGSAGPSRGAGVQGSGASVQPAVIDRSAMGSPGTAAPEVGAAASMRELREAAELEHKAKAGLAGLPTSVEGFSAHPLYVLKRHIKKYEALRPGSLPLGLHKGEPYYARDALSELHTVDVWRRQGWQVRPEEVDKPAKVTKRKKQPAPRGGGGGGHHGGGMGRGLWRGGAWGLGRGRGGGRTTNAPPAPAPTPTAAATATAPVGGAPDQDGEEEPQTKLYGRWQAEPLILSAQDGRVPKNERGNVEVPPLAASLPIGCVHLPYPGLGPICRALGVDFAPALAGFEVQGGRSYPRIDGVVVCTEAEVGVMAAYVERESARAAAATARHEREMRAAWLQLLKALLMRRQLADDYGATQGVQPQDGAHPAGREKKRKHKAEERSGEPGSQGGLQQRSLAQQQVMQRLLTEAAEGGGHSGQGAAGPGLDEEEI